MTIDDAIETVDRLKPSSFEGTQIIGWLNDVDGQVFREIIQTHNIRVRFRKYDDSTPGDTVLLVPEPYSKMYLWYIMAQIDLYNNEIPRYNNNIALYNNEYLTYQDYVNRSVMPKKPVKYLKVW